MYKRRYSFVSSLPAPMVSKPCSTSPQMPSHPDVHTPTIRHNRTTDQKILNAKSVLFYSHFPISIVFCVFHVFQQHTPTIASSLTTRPSYPNDLISITKHTDGTEEVIYQEKIIINPSQHQPPASYACRQRKLDSEAKQKTLNSQSDTMCM